MELPPLGSEVPNSKTKIMVRYFVGVLDYPENREQAEELMTRSILSENTLSKVGDIAIFKEETSFDKQGNAHLLLKYGELCELP
jgi:hypothetical protein